MNDQLQIFSGEHHSPQSAIAHRRRLNSYERITRDFHKFHQENPVVYKTLHELALFVLASGRKHYGIKSLWERMRWHFEFEVSGSEEFRLNNNFTSHYARLLMEREPKLARFFDTRELISRRNG